MSSRNVITKPEQEKSSVRFTPTDAKVALLQHSQTVTGLAAKLGLARNTVSMAINRGLFPRVRALIAAELHLPS